MSPFWATCLGTLVCMSYGCVYLAIKQSCSYDTKHLSIHTRSKHDCLLRIWLLQSWIWLIENLNFEVDSSVLTLCLLKQILCVLRLLISCNKAILWLWYKQLTSRTKHLSIHTRGKQLHKQLPACESQVSGIWDCEDEWPRICQQLSRKHQKMRQKQINCEGWHML